MVGEILPYHGHVQHLAQDIGLVVRARQHYRHTKKYLHPFVQHLDVSASLFSPESAEGTLTLNFAATSV